MSNAKFNKIDVQNLSVPSNGFYETLNFFATASDFTFNAGSPDTTIISITIPANAHIRKGTWKIKWSYFTGSPGGPLSHTLYFKRNGVIKKTFISGGFYIINWPVNFQYLQNLSLGESVTFSWVVHDSGTGGNQAIFKDNILVVRWINDNFV